MGVLGREDFSAGFTCFGCFINANWRGGRHFAGYYYFRADTRMLTNTFYIVKNGLMVHMARLESRKFDRKRTYHS